MPKIDPSDFPSMRARCLPRCAGHAKGGLAARIAAGRRIVVPGQLPRPVVRPASVPAQAAAPSEAVHGASDSSGGDPVRARAVADHEERPELGLDAVEQLVVGVAERPHALALELAGDGVEVDARVVCSS